MACEWCWALVAMGDLCGQIQRFLTRPWEDVAFLANFGRAHFPERDLPDRRGSKRGNASRRKHVGLAEPRKARHKPDCETKVWATPSKGE